MKKRLVFSILLTLLSSGLFFLFNFILAKVLGADAYGKIQYYISFIQLISLSFSLNYASLYMGNKILKKDEDTISLFITTQSFLFLILLIPTIIILSSAIDNNIVITLLVATSYLFVIMISISLEYNSEKKIILSILTGSLISRVLLIAFFSLMMWLGYSLPLHYLFAYLASISVVVIFSILRLKPKNYLSFTLFSRAWKFYLLGLIGSSFTYIAQILQKELYGFSQLAVLAISLLIMTGLGIWGSLLIKIILPTAHDFWHKKDLIGISKIYKNNTYLELITIFPIFFLVLFNIDYLSSILGPSYEKLPYFFYILSIGYLFNLITGITGTLLRVTENEKFELFNEFIRLIIGLILIYLLRDNTYGIAIAISASMSIYNLLKFLELFYLFKLWPLTREYLIQALILLTMSSALLFCASIIENKHLSLLATIVGLFLSYTYIYRLIITNTQLLKTLKFK